MPTGHGSSRVRRRSTYPAKTACVVVRGHDETHGYGGRAMLVTLDSGATRAVEQGNEAASFTEADCPSQ